MVSQNQIPSVPFSTPNPDPLSMILSTTQDPHSMIPSFPATFPTHSSCHARCLHPHSTSSQHDLLSKSTFGHLTQHNHIIIFTHKRFCKYINMFNIFKIKSLYVVILIQKMFCIRILKMS